MEKDFTPYKIALELKELGFDEPCFVFYTYEGKFSNELSFNEYKNTALKTSAPTLSQAFRWFREKYNLVHEISWSKSKGGVSFDYDIFSLVLPTDDELGDEDDVYIDRPMETYDSLAGKTFRDMEFDSYEGAELAAILKLIEIVKNK